MLRRFILLSFVLVLTLGTISTKKAYSQIEDQLPPQVIDVWPAPGSELLPSDLLTITFDQPMEQSRVEAAFSLTPSLTGKFTWNDAQTMQFAPNGGWPRARVYKLTINPQAIALTGAALEDPYVAKLRTLSGLAVTQVSPANDALEVALDAKIVVSFNRPVVPLGAPDQPGLLKIEPPIEGKGEWVNTSIYKFTPTQQLKNNTRYTIHVEDGLTATDTSIMDQAYSWSFSTLPPQVVSIQFQPEAEQGSDYPIDPRSVPLDQPIYVTFSQPMDKTSTERAFSLTGNREQIEGVFSWSADSKHFTFKPSRYLRSNMDYKVTIAGSARSADGGGPLSKSTELAFHTFPYPAVARTEPRHGARNVRLNETPRLIFNVPMDFKNERDLKSKIIISPAVEQYSIDPWNYGLAISSSLKRKTTYTITLKAGLKDIYGNAIGRDYTFSFTTGDVDYDREKPRFAPQLNSDLMIVDARQANMAVTTDFVSDGAVNMNLYRFPPTELGNKVLRNHQIYDGSSGGYYGGMYGWNDSRRCESPPLVKAKNLIRSWTYTLDTQAPSQRRRQVPLASAKGGQLAPGLYWITMGDTWECNEWEDYAGRDSGDTLRQGPEWQWGLAVVTANLTVKRGTEDLFIWATNLSDTSPLAGAKVTVYGGGKALSTGTTGGDGTVRLPVRVLEYPFILITAEAPHAFGAWYNYYTSMWRGFEGEVDYEGVKYYAEPPNSQGYVYTDRPIYRPGDTVYFRGILRNKRDMNFPVPASRKAYLKIGKGSLYYNYLYRDEHEPWLVEREIDLTELGTFSGDYKIPEDMNPDSLVIQVSLTKTPPNISYYVGGTREDAVIQVTVAAYRASAFEVKVKPKRATIFQGDPLEATIAAEYYAGGGVGDANIGWGVTVDQSGFQYTGPGQYNFGYSSWYYYGYADDDGISYEYSTYQHFEDKGTAKADSNGRATITTRKTSFSDQYDYKPPIRITIEGTASDESGQVVSGRTSVIAYPANLYIGFGTGRYIGRVGESLTVNLIAVTADSQPKPNQKLAVQLNHYYATGGETGIRPGDKAEITTDLTGKAQFIFTPQVTGAYYLTISGVDEKGRSNQNTLHLWITDEKNKWVFEAEAVLQPIVDRSRYQIGDTADILLPVPPDGTWTTLLTVERAGVMQHIILPPNGPTLSHQFKITADFAPTAYITATYIAKPDDKHAYPRFRVSGPQRISVEPTQSRLSVSVTPSNKSPKPGETVNFDLRVTASDGKPVRAEVGLALVDKAVLALMPPNSEPLERAFYSRQAHRVFTDLSLDALLESANQGGNGPPGFGGGACCGGGTIDLRQRFETTPLWMPHVMTDSNGQAAVSVKLPDNLTTWQLDARALTLDMQVGQTTTEIVSSLPLIIRPVTPRFFVAGDSVRLAAIVNNNTDEVQQVRVSLDAKGVRLLSEKDHDVTVQPGGRGRAEWSVVVEDVLGADLSFYANAQSGLGDATKPSFATGPNNTIKVLRYIVQDSGAATSGVLRAGGSRTEAIVLPPRWRGAQGDLLVRLDPSLAATLPDSLTYLRQYPHYCIEQTVSRFLPNLSTYRALRDLSIDDPVLVGNLKPQVAAALEKLAKEQKADGSWGWYPTMNTDPLTSAYAALGLVEARNAGFAVDSTILDKAVKYVTSQLNQPLGIQIWQLNRQAFYLYVLARAGKGTLPQLNALFAVRSRLSYAARAYLLMAYQERAPSARAATTLQNDLISAAIITSLGVHWEEKEPDWYNWGTDTRTTALALTALIRIDPKNTLLPNIVRWLMAARQADYWPTTQETVWAITGLSEWMMLTGELRGSYRYTIGFNKQNIASARVTPDTIHEGQTLHIAVQDLLTQNANRLVVSRDEGAGALYYTARFALRLPASEATAVNRGITLKREYFKDSNLKVPVTNATVGETITVRLTISVPQDLHYFALEDTYPAGTEPVDTSLLTTSLTAQGSNFGRLSRDDPYWYWGWWYFKQAELRDSQANLYADYLPAGTYVHTYQLRASVAGKFNTIPTFAYTFYQPEIYGRTDGTLFTIWPEGAKEF